MKRSPRVGETGEIRFHVGDQQTIGFDGMPAVLSTPALVWCLEHAARNALHEALESDESSVGVHVDLEHLAATPIGMEVVCTARVIHCDGSLISFQLLAHDARELIARGVHKRRVIRVDRFAARVHKKADGQ